MTILSALSLGVQGIQSGMNRTAIAAGKIAGGIAHDPDAARSMVGLRQGATESQASASVVKAIDQTLGSLIDLRA